MLLQYHLSGVSNRNWDVTVYTCSLLSALFRKPDILEFKPPERKASALSLSEGRSMSRAVCTTRRVLQFTALPLADLTTQLWKWTNSAQQNPQPAVQKCPKRH